MDYDVVIAGAGPAGVSTAVALVRRDPSLKKRIVVLDRAKLSARKAVRRRAHRPRRRSHGGARPRARRTVGAVAARRGALLGLPSRGHARQARARHPARRLRRQPGRAGARSRRRGARGRGVERLCRRQRGRRRRRGAGRAAARAGAGRRRRGWLARAQVAQRRVRRHADPPLSLSRCRRTAPGARTPCSTTSRP